jgi:hypothetical protein
VRSKLTIVRGIFYCNYLGQKGEDIEKLSYFLERKLTEQRKTSLQLPKWCQIY